MEKPRIYYVHWVLSPYRAMTIPPFGIFIRRQYRGNKRIINHDMIHWKQYQRMGLFRFYFQYFKEFLTCGYNKMPMEIEARYEESEDTKKHYSEKYHN